MLNVLSQCKEPSTLFWRDLNVILSKEQID